MKATAVIVSADNTRSLRKSKRKLKRFGCCKISDTKYRGILRSKKTLRMLKEYCRERKLRFCLESAYGARRSPYRSVFFQTRRPDLFGRYFCVYCGKLLSRSSMTVDHLYPIAELSRNAELQKKLKRAGIDHANAPKNLVAACDRCNKQKGTQMGDWIRKGKRGSHRGYWIMKRLMVVLVILLLTYLILSCFVPELRLKEFSALWDYFRYRG